MNTTSLKNASWELYQQPFTAKPPTGYREPTLLDRIKKVAWRIFSIIIFPIGLFEYLGEKLIVPASCMFVRLNHKKELARDGKDLVQTYDGKRNTLITPDGVKLDSVFFSGSKNPEKVVIYCGGNRCFMEQQWWMVEKITKKLGYSLLLFNPRGVGNSTGSPSDEGFALDTYTAAEYLAKCGHDYNDMIFYGHSLGGYRAVSGAALIQEMHPDKEIKVVNDRSFSSIPDIARHVSVTDIFRMIFGKPKKTTSKKVNSTIFPRIMQFFGWNYNTLDYWKKIKGENKIVIFDPRDEIIPYEAQLIMGLSKASQYDYLSISLRETYDPAMLAVQPVLPQAASVNPVVQASNTGLMPQTYFDPELVEVDLFAYGDTDQTRALESPPLQSRQNKEVDIDQRNLFDDAELVGSDDFDIIEDDDVEEKGFYPVNYHKRPLFDSEDELLFDMIGDFFNPQKPQRFVSIVF
jgi:Chlamydia CHLPS protein (DUF818)